MSRKERGWLYPTVINGPRTSVCVPVPIDERHRQAFLGALRELSFPQRWQFPEGEDPNGAAREWTEIFDIVAARLGTETCVSEASDCRDYGNTAEFIEYFPNDPRYTPNLIGEGYNAPAWYFATDLSNAVYGTVHGDIVTSLDRFPPGSLPTILPASGLPRCRVTVNVVDGGRLRVYMRNMVAGSMVQTTIDDDILTVKFWDVTKDLISLPAETGDLVIYEQDFPVGGLHHVDLIVVSKVNDEIPFLFHGGAIVKVEVCGEAQEGQVDCCQPVLVLLNQQNEYFIIGENAARDAIYDGNPTDIDPDAPTGNFADGDADRRTALCMAIREYVYSQTWRRGNAECARLGIVAALATVGGFLIGGPLGAIIGGAIVGVSVYDCSQWEAALTDTDGLNEAICAIFGQFNGLPVTEANFNAVMSDISGGNAQIIDTLEMGANSHDNYLYFLDLLGNAYRQAQAGASDDCTCAETCEVTFDWRVSAYNAVVDLGYRVAGEGIVAEVVAAYKEFDLTIDLAEKVRCKVEADYWRELSGGNAIYMSWYEVDGGTITHQILDVAKSAAAGENSTDWGTWTQGWDFNRIRVHSGQYNIDETLREIRLVAP